MATQKQKILVIENSYRQFQIIRDLLKHDYEILPDITDEEQFISLRSKLMRFLDEEDNDFPTELNNYNDVTTFIVDYKLADGNDKTGILFCKLTESISNGSKSVLFLTICPDAEIENEIRTIEDEIPEINCDNLRKPKLWDKESKPVASVVIDSQSILLKTSIKKKIDKLIQRSTKKNQPVHDTSE
jgi:hypothetical protein